MGGAKTQNMTEGNSMRHLVLFFMPLVAGNLFQQLYSVVDSIIVGKGLGDKALAAVGSSGVFNFMIFGFIMGVTKGYGILFSQAFGKEDEKLLRKYIAASARLCFFTSIVITIICVSVIKPVFRLMQTPADIFDDAYRYYIVILACIMITVWNNFVITILQSLGDSRTPLVAMIISSLCNISLDCFFILVLKTGVEGASIATVIAQVISCLYCFIQVRKTPMVRGAVKLDNVDLKTQLFGEPDFKGLYIKLLKMGIPVGFMNSITAIGAMMLQYFVNLMNSTYVAAYSVSMRFTNMFEGFGVSMGLAVLTFVGQNYGAGKYDRIRVGVRNGLFLSAVINTPLVLLMIFANKYLVSTMLNSSEAIGYCQEFMPVTGIFLYILGFLFVYRYAVQGVGNTFIPMLSGFLEVAMRVSFGFIFATKYFKGVAFAEVSAWTGACIMIMITYYVLMGKLHVEK